MKRCKQSGQDDENLPKIMDQPGGFYVWTRCLEVTNRHSPTSQAAGPYSKLRTNMYNDTQKLCEPDRRGSSSSCASTQTEISALYEAACLLSLAGFHAARA